MLTPKMSLRRNNVISIYAAVMQALYAGQGTSSGTVEISSLGAPKTVPYVICDLPWVRFIFFCDNCVVFVYDSHYNLLGAGQVAGAPGGSRGGAAARKHRGERRQAQVNATHCRGPPLPAVQNSIVSLPDVSLLWLSVRVCFTYLTSSQVA